MRTLVLLFLLGLASAQGEASKGPPEGFRPAPGGVYLVPAKGFALPQEVWTWIGRGPVRILWQPALIGEGEVRALAAALRGKGVAVEVRAYRLYPPLSPMAVGPNWAYLPPSRWTVWAVEVGSALKVVSLAWENSPR